ncbi:hypothetical protein WMY93_017887 [Mugilogobius chulae]|uniref:Attractin-like protein 1 n=1 Tax=Mugilogobius chulae TaxID=88201 RepID=A0AAW0NK30_9GOBI
MLRFISENIERIHSVPVGDLQHVHAEDLEQSGSLTDGPVNYKHKTKCTWLLEARPNSVLRLRFSHFATECSWDHMYVYDGDSIFSPLVAVFSGLLVPQSAVNVSVPEVVCTSGFALLHFFSDAAYNLTGFNVHYTLDSCPQNCSGHGFCTLSSVSGTVSCDCEKHWRGHACHIHYCPDDCGGPERGYCDVSGRSGVCATNTGKCEALVPVPRPGVPSGRAAPGLMWVVGGYSFNYSSYNLLLNYELDSRTWDEVRTSSGPGPRYGHSVALHQDRLYMFGGKLETGSAQVTDELWVFHIPGRVWTPLRPAPGPVSPLEGHSAHVVHRQDGQAVMLVFWGYSPLHGYLDTVQEYHTGERRWQVLSTRGTVVQGSYGHSSVYDQTSDCVFLHGGYKALGHNKYGLVDHLYRYHVHSRTWWILKSSGLPRYLHSMALLSGTLLVFGGNTHNDTSQSNGAKCFSADFLSYDIACDDWSVLPTPALPLDVQRFGHSAVVSNKSMYIFGGFSGLLLTDVLVYTASSCLSFTDPSLCATAGPGVRCHWLNGSCVAWQPQSHDLSTPDFCTSPSVTRADQCLLLSDCGSCTSSSADCQWCEEQGCVSAHGHCSVGVTEWSWCPHTQQQQQCLRLNTCRSCSLNPHCQWEEQECQPKPGEVCEEGWELVGQSCLKIIAGFDSYDNGQHYCKNQGGNMASLLSQSQVSYVLEELSRHQQLRQKLSPWVGLRKINVSYWAWEDTSAFTNTSLRWLPGEPSDSGFCASMERVDLVSLKAKPCTANTTGLICEKTAVETCSGLLSCSDCLQRVECGWCADPSHTGTGVCIEGSYRGPLKPQAPSSRQGPGLRDRDMQLDQSVCAAEKGFSWAFIHCPACQCNGHSRCVNSSVCERCEDLTSGPHCESCVPGYYGDPTNGGHCQENCVPGYYGDPTNGGHCQEDERLQDFQRLSCVLDLLPRPPVVLFNQHNLRSDSCCSSNLLLLLKPPVAPQTFCCSSNLRCSSNLPSPPGTSVLRLSLCLSISLLSPALLLLTPPQTLPVSPVPPQSCSSSS